MNAYLELQHIRKTFGETKVLNGVNLSVGEGELITLLGPSGCGKSTLLRCIAGLTDFEEGRILLAERDLTALPPRKREVGMVFQSYALFPNLTAGENIEYGMKMHGESKQARRKRTEELLAMVELEEKRDVYPQYLSGGQQQRIALARSLAVQPKLLLLDEPLSALDAQIRKNLRTEIRDIQRRMNMTTIFVTHDQEEALTVSDRVCIMNRGNIVQEGSPEEVYLKPRTEFAARFMGNYNVLSRPEALRLFPNIDGAAEGFALRPEAIKLVDPDENMEDSLQAGSAVVAATIHSASVLGTILRYTVEAAGVQLTIDVLNDGRAISSQDQTDVRLVLDPLQLLHLEKEGA